LSDPRAIAQIINAQWSNIVKHLNNYQIRTLNAIRRCRTPALGGHLYVCDSCKAKHYRYNSCRNRHCSQCQNTQKEQWIQNREEQMIQATYYHVVFTLPDVLNEFCLVYPKHMYNFLFKAAWQTLLEFGFNNKHLGAQIGATMVLHTWGSNMCFHPHIHCIVPGGGVNFKNQWKDSKGKGKFLFPVKALSMVFRGKYVKIFKDYIISEGMEYLPHLHKKLYKNEWVVYAKPPFGGAKGVIRYLARYTHNIAISHHRIIAHDKHKVIFKYTDYRHANQKKSMPLCSWEFVRRFALHILPKGYMRIRHFVPTITVGINAKWKKIIFPELPNFEKPDWISFWKAKGLDVLKCPYCLTGSLQAIGKLEPVRGPPNINVKREMNIQI
jgi:hypothetical protein